MSACLPATPVPPVRDDVWHGDALGRAGHGVLASGHAALDAELPGGGWPAAGLTELLQAEPTWTGSPAWRLLLPALRATTGGPVALIGAPAGLQPFVPALAAQGLPPTRLLWVRASDEKGGLWAAEQALRCADVPAVLAWLPRARADGLRRLHLAALDHGKPLFACRPATAQAQSSPAPLRLTLQGGLLLQVLVFKRRGPPMLQPLALPPEPRWLALLQGGRAATAQQPLPGPALARQGLQAQDHVLDRAVAA